MKLKFLGKTINIIYFKDTTRSDNRLGRSDSKTMEIWISESLSYEMKMETLIHELLHIMSDSFYLELDEQKVSCLANVLNSVILENKLWEYKK